MPIFSYSFTDDHESCSGSVEAGDIALAALTILQGDGGVASGEPRWKRNAISEKAVVLVPDNTEFVIFHRLSDAAYRLEIKKIGSRKRKSVQVFA